MEYARFYDLDHGNTAAVNQIIRVMDRAYLEWAEKNTPKPPDTPPPKVKRA